MIDYFALLGVERRPWLEPEELKEKYFARNRAEPASAEVNEAFRVLHDPKLRLQHLLVLEGAELSAGRPVPAAVAELFWETGNLLREIERWALRKEAAAGSLARALLQPERVKLAQRLAETEEQLQAAYAQELSALRAPPNELAELVESYDRIAYLSRLRERAAEKRLQLELA